MTYALYLIIYIASLAALWRYLRHPLDKLRTGIDLLNEQDFSSRLTHVGNKRADEVVDLFNRMMAQLKDERLSVRETNHFLDLLIKASPMGVVIPSTSTVNPAARRMLSAELEREMHRLNVHESRVVRSAGNVFRISRHHLIDRAVPRDFYLIELLTEEVRQAERTAYEKVIRMIVHEVNNTVAGTSSAMSTLTDCLSEMSDDGQYDDLRQMAETCAERQTQLSQFVTRFADVVKLPAPQLLPTPLAPLLDSCISFVSALATERGIVIDSHYDKAGQWNIDATLFEQVLINVLKNSIESGASRIEVSAGTTYIIVTDNGSGISPETASQLFTPFFTTKPTGQGLGLLLIREVLTAHHLHFSLATDKNALTHFEIHQ